MNKKIQHLEANTQGRDFVIGDLHGCFDGLNDLLLGVNFDTSVDRLISVGDLIDRGPQSMECVDLLYLPWFYAVRGNHEQLMIDSTLNNHADSTDCWIGNGGTWALSYHETELRIAAKRMDELPLVITVGEGDARFNVVHADLYNDSHLYHLNRLTPLTNTDVDEWKFTRKDEDNMIWGRTIIGHDTLAANIVIQDPDKLSITYVGHTPARKILRAQQQIYLDTGAVYHHTSKLKSEQNSLTVACPTNGMFYQYNMMWKTVTSYPIADVELAKDQRR